MELQKQKGHDCLVYATAMLLDVPAEELIKEIGHDSEDILWPELEPRSKCKRGFHIREMIEVCMSRGFALTPIELYPSHCPWGREDLVKPLWETEEAQQRFSEVVLGRKGIILCPPTMGVGHAVAFDGKDCYDPRMKIYPITHVKILEFWMLTQIIPKII